MSLLSRETSPQLRCSLERFYFAEARLLDGRQYRQWLSLVDPEIRYVVPARPNVQVDSRLRGKEDMLSVERELEDADSMGCPIREEGYIHLMLRVERAYKINSWSENPPPRTRRLIGNIELMDERGGELEVYSNFHLSYARPGSPDYLYAGQRRDRLVPGEDGFLIRAREVILDLADIDQPTLGLLF